MFFSSNPKPYQHKCFTFVIVGQSNSYVAVDKLRSLANMGLNVMFSYLSDWKEQLNTIKLIQQFCKTMKLVSL